MKVLYTNVAIPSYAHPLLEKITSRGCDLVMLLPENNDNTVGKGVKFADTKVRSYRVCYSRSKQMWYRKPALIDLKNTLIQEKPDIVMIVWPYFLHLFFDRSILKLMQKNKMRLIIREIPFQTPPFGQLNYFKSNPVFTENMELQSRGISFKLRALLTMYIRRFLYRRADASLNYASHALQILPSYGMNQDTIFVSYNTSDTDSLLSERERIIQSPRLLLACRRILHIGRLVKWKRVDLLIDAFRKIVEKYPDCELVIIGDGPEKEALIRQAKETGLTERIIFAGAIYDSYTLGRYMYESTIYVLAGMGGLSINDAMCFSLPVICSVCDGTEKDLITDGVNGCFFKEGDVDSLTDKIDKILSDKERCKQMGEESYRVIKEKINLDTVAQRYMDAFKYVMNKK
ncbi:MAG: glycosyltransferase family 4 protein [Prevotellaceae bacterium]|jgi:glycosyltransferase involved in cell wall biosynthesis|nr:glycosyltransferase family 4 protein [Prevotellaceae bacterium]